MAERLKEKLLETEKLVDIVVGPDSYRELPSLVAEAEAGHKAVNVLLSREETYADWGSMRTAHSTCEGYERSSDERTVAAVSEGESKEKPQTTTYLR